MSDYFIVVIKPDIHISTVEAYRNVIPKTLSVDLRNAIKLPIQEWKDSIFNDFEAGIFNTYPTIASLKDSLYESGALYASMSGSGSSVFGIFKEPVVLDHLSCFGKIYYPVTL